METRTYSTLPNGLKASIDYLAFTLFSEMTLNEVYRFLGIPGIDFCELEKGANGYKSIQKHKMYEIRLYYDGKPNMGIHVEIRGSAIGFLFSSFSKQRYVHTSSGHSGHEANTFQYADLARFFRAVLNRGHFSRVDLAVDDIGNKFMSTHEVNQLAKSDRVVSKWRNNRHIENRCHNITTGETVYFGSRKSNIMLRIYDKQMEQKTSFPWTRWELELHDEHADEAVKQIMDGLNLGFVIVGLLNNYIRFVENDNARKDRCSILSVWKCFLDGIRKLRIYIAKEQPTIDKKKQFLEKQVSKTLFMVASCYGADYVESLIDMGFYKTSRNELDMISYYIDHHPELNA